MKTEIITNAQKIEALADALYFNDGSIIRIDRHDFEMMRNSSTRINMLVFENVANMEILIMHIKLGIEHFKEGLPCNAIIHIESDTEFLHLKNLAEIADVMKDSGIVHFRSSIGFKPMLDPENRAVVHLLMFSYS